MPVTDTEVIMKEGTILVTRTDLKGVITYANDEFVAISGFSYEELVGSSHNIVRHPEMPAAAFKDLWATIKADKPWTQLIKNRTKSGDYYWVEANVTPIFKAGTREVTGFLSVRYAPSRSQINTAEALYTKLHANSELELKDTGIKCIFKKVKEIPIKFKLMLVTLLFLLPNICVMKSLFESEQFAHLSGVVSLLLLAIIILYGVADDMLKMIKNSRHILHNLVDNNFRNKIDLSRNDEIGLYLQNLYSAQVKLNADLAYSNQVSNESLRLKQALDSVSSAVMVADMNLNIIYMNPAVKELFSKAEDSIKQQFKGFEVNKLLGANIDMFHKNPSHQRNILKSLSSTFSSEIQVGAHTMNLTANPVLNESNECSAIVVEWIDRTEELAVEKEIADLVIAVKEGDLSSRINLNNKEGFFETLSTGVNDLSDAIEPVFLDINNIMDNISNGNLTQQITNDYSGVYGECSASINSTIDKLGSIFSQINDSSKFIVSASNEIASGNNNLSERVESQASSLEETASSMEQLTSTVKTNADNAQQANKLSSSAWELAEKGGEVVVSAVNAMSEINDSSTRIGEMIGVIDEIAFQTNLLALNASVEAARAGEQGRGFAVVATEVRNLAQRSAVAARESKELIQTSIQRVRTGTNFVNEAGDALSEIVGGVKGVGDIIAEIASASTEQSQGIEQVNIAISQMDEITQQNAALAEEASAASVSMNEHSQNMMKLLNFFTLNPSENDVLASSFSSYDEFVLPTITTPSPVAAASQPKPHASAVVATKPLVGIQHEDDEWDEF